jgi:hypothetical protein
MIVYFINYNSQENLGRREVNVQSLRLDSENCPYAIVNDPVNTDSSVRADYTLYDGVLQWVADLS